MPPRPRDPTRTRAGPDADLVVDQVSVDQVSVDRVSVDQVSVDEGSVDQGSVDQGSVDQGLLDADGDRNSVDLSKHRAPTPGGVAGAAHPSPSARNVAAGIDIRWTEEGACIVELRGRPTRAMLAKARDLLWSRSPQDRLTIVVSEAVLTRELFALLIAGRRRLSSSGVLEIVGLDAPGAVRIANSHRPPR